MHLETGSTTNNIILRFKENIVVFDKRQKQPCLRRPKCFQVQKPRTTCIREVSLFVRCNSDGDEEFGIWLPERDRMADLIAAA